MTRCFNAIRQRWIVVLALARVAIDRVLFPDPATDRIAVCDDPSARRRGLDPSQEARCGRDGWVRFGDQGPRPALSRS